MSTPSWMFPVLWLGLMLSLTGCAPGGTDNPQGPMRPVICTRTTPLPPPATGRIPPAGGSLALGPHRFEVPEGALASPVQLTFRVVPSDTAAVEITPAGTTFDPPARLILKYGDFGCGRLRLNANVEIWRFDAQGNRTVLPATHSWLFKRVTTEAIDHLSRYVLASD